VPNIFWAKPGDYRKAVHRIYHAAGKSSYVALPVVRQTTGRQRGRRREDSRETTGQQREDHGHF
jgi:hypothetical protein